MSVRNTQDVVGCGTGNDRGPLAASSPTATARYIQASGAA